jgi:predicted phosphoadenosine phosphosulfate sulfurtransferase
MKINESLVRRTLLTGQKKALYKHITWCSKKDGVHQNFYPIYDWEDSDIWTAIAKNKWKYNRIYDLQYQYGVARKDMRVSALIHETSWHALEMLQEFEPETYNKFLRRVKGVNTFAHLFDQDGTKVKELPFMFKDWKEYRDYLLENIVKKEYFKLFSERWKDQEGDDWYKVHVKELLVNDIDGTINNNARANLRNKAKGNLKHEKNMELLKQYVKGKEEND